MKIYSRKQLSKYIEHLVHEKNMSYISALLYYCEKNNIDEENIPSRIELVLKQKIKKEAEELNYFPKSPSVL